MLLREFYAGTGKDNVGRTFDDIMAMRDDAMDAAHDWVQWVFPTDEPSNFNDQAPLLTAEDIAFIKADKDCQTNLDWASRRFLRYLGLVENDGVITPDFNFNQRRKVLWLEFNHNYLRITRFLYSLRLLGREERSKELLRCLIALNEEKSIAMSANTRSHWENTQVINVDHDG